MPAEPRHKSRKHQIEPLNWAEAAQSPALKGMLSFLDVSAEDVRNGQNQNPDLQFFQTVSEVLAVSESLPGVESSQSSAIPAIPTVTATRKSGPRTIATAERPVSEALPVSSADKGTGDLIPASEVLLISEVLAVSESLPVSKVLPVSESRTGSSFRGVRNGIVLGVVSSQNRKIRRCRLVHDAHSAGEELLYRILWEEARPDPMNPMGSRSLRMGYAELAAKARMHKTNVRLNLANLKAKLAVEVLEEHSSTELIPRLYRIFSFREILDRRKAAGLEYVIRQKNVVFVNPDGTPMPQSTAAGRSQRRLDSRKKADFTNS